MIVFSALSQFDVVNLIPWYVFFLDISISSLVLFYFFLFLYFFEISDEVYKNLSFIRSIFRMDTIVLCFFCL